MDGDRFDKLARQMAFGTSRRGFLRAAAGVVATTVGLRRSRGEAAQRGGKCTSDDDCGSCLICEPGTRGRPGRCIPDPTSEGLSCTGECGICSNGLCTGDDDHCSGCDRCNSRSLICESRCRRNDICCDGKCRKQGTAGCCASEDDCNACQICSNGVCTPDPVQQGRECGDCKRCDSGECTEADPELLCGDVCCPSDELCIGLVTNECCPIDYICRDAFGTPNNCCRDGSVCTQEDSCCPIGREACGAVIGDGAYNGAFRECCAIGESCVNGECCPDNRKCGDICCTEGQACNPIKGTCCTTCGDGKCCDACVDTGIFGEQYCCDPTANQPCGSNGDGTYRECCPSSNSVCCPSTDTCVASGECCPKSQFNLASSQCCQDGPSCGDSCCEKGERCDATTETCVSCPEGQLSCGSECCPDDQYMCQDGACVCPSGRQCDGGCCPAGEKCCHGGCIPDDQTCCEPGDPECCAEDETPCWAGEGGYICCSGGDACCHGFCIGAEELCCDIQQYEEACGDICCSWQQGCCGDSCCCEDGTTFCQLADGSSTCCPIGEFCCETTQACQPESHACCYSGHEACGASCCTPEQGCCDDHCCCGDEQRQCPDGSCAGKHENCCEDGLEECDGTCIDTVTDRNNCGACGLACNLCEECTEGRCINKECEGCAYCDDSSGECVEGCLNCQVCNEELQQCRDRSWTPPVCQDCVNGEVVDGVACGDQCCPAGSNCCGDQCCDGDCCGDLCCASGAGCCEGRMCMGADDSCCCTADECAICPPFHVPHWYCMVNDFGHPICSSNAT